VECLHSRREGGNTFPNDECTVRVLHENFRSFKLILTILCFICEIRILHRKTEAFFCGLVNHAGWVENKI
jgi:hypothetical protein